jgi:hypothetical protein
MGRFYATPPDRFQPFKNIRVGIKALEKLCTKCGLWKTLCYNNYQRDSAREYGYESQCKLCMNIYSKTYRDKNK